MTRLEGLLRRLIMVVAVSFFFGLAAKALDFSDIGISERELSEFLDRLRHEAARSDRTALCGLLAYPMQVSDARLHHAEIYDSPRACEAKFHEIFSKDVLEKMTHVSLSDLEEIKGMLMAYDGAFWISKYYISQEPQRATSGQTDFSDTKYWQMRIVDINRGRAKQAE